MEDGRNAGAGNGKITLTFLNNNLTVTGDFFPPASGGSPITHEYIAALLTENNIRYGIQHDEINRALEECVKTNAVVAGVRIAQGEPAFNEVPEYLQLNPLFERKNPAPVNETDPVDHRERSPFIIVKKDQALAKLKRHKPGRDGKNVHGDSIGYNVTNPAGLLAGGENTRMEDRYLLSNINGQLVVNKKVVSVRDSLVIKGPVGYGTGNIIFPGNVEIHGEVSDGFKIYSGGSVSIKQTFDVTDAITKGDLNVAGGIIGRGRALVKVGGSLKTKFIDNCHVACRKTISVDLEIVNSRIFTLESLVMGDKGRIVGGEIYALTGVRAGSVGRKTGKAARIHCGVDFTLEQEKEKNNAVLRILAVRLGRLKEIMEDARAGGETMAKLQAIRQRLEEEQRKAQARVSEILGQPNAREDAVVEVKGEITGGTLIEICQTALFVTEPLKKVRIRLDRNNNRLVTEKL
ncbi:MAG: FapA family protein [Treponema sp.]|nr:FapA family protein [Treponema sp.]